jgi:hypothetical protein
MFMFKHRLIFTLLLFGVQVMAQTPKSRVISIPVLRNGILLSEPWVGGVNAPQFSYGDLNHDGIKDLFIFDREGSKVLTYLSNGDGSDSMYHYAPQYEALFPPGLIQFAMLRDYNNDGIPDLFTFNGNAAGIEVYKGSIQNDILHYDLVCPVIKYTDSPYVTTAFANYTDMPAIVDVNRDGDLDILSYAVFGTSVVYFENQSKEHPGDPHYDIDSFQYTQVTSCWGNFSQNAGSNSIELNVSCKGGSGADTANHGGGARHAGNSLYPLLDPQYRTIDLLNGNIGFDNLDFIQNCGDSSYANMCSVDSIYPLCDVPIIMRDYPAAFGIDVNNDGLEDLLIAPNQTTEARDVKNVMYYKNTGNPSCLYTYQSDSFLVNHMLDFGTASKAVFYDFNGDGLLDIIVGNYGYFEPSNPYKSTLAYYQNTGTATHPLFTMQTEDYNNFSAYGLQGLNPAFGDLDGDGKADLLLGDISGNLHYFKNMASTGSSYPSMTVAQYFNINVGPYSAPFIYDVNGDSLNDLIIGNQNGTLSYYWNFGTKDSARFSADSVNISFGNINVTVSPNSIGYSQPFIRKDSAGNMLLFVGSLSGLVYEYVIDPNQLRGGNFNRITTDFIGQPVGYNSTISIADINGDGQLEYLIGNSRGGLIMYSDSVWDPGTSLGINEINASPIKALHIYPNPAKDYVVCALGQQEFTNPQTEVFNVLGEKLNITASLTNNKITLNTGQLSNGFYIVRINQNGEIFTGKFMVEK